MKAHGGRRGAKLNKPTTTRRGAPRRPEEESEGQEEGEKEGEEELMV